MTKYVLNSGGLRANEGRAKEYIAELLADMGAAPKVLMCMFAQPREVWEEKYAVYSRGFTDWSPSGQKPVYELAFPDKFAEQVVLSDVVYIYGGDDHLVQYWLRKFNIAKLFENKTIGTNSASSSALTHSFWTCDWRTCMNGLNILPIKFIPHYNSAYGRDDPREPINWKAAKQDLENYGDTILPIFALQEADFVVMNT